MALTSAEQRELDELELEALNKEAQGNSNQNQKGNFERAMEFVDMPRSAAVSGAAELAKRISGQNLGLRDVSPSDVYGGKGLKSKEILSAMGVNTDKTVNEKSRELLKDSLSPEIMKMMGISEENDKSITNYRMSAIPELAMDVATDPTTYLAGPISQGISKFGEISKVTPALKSVTEGVSKLGNKIYDIPFSKMNAVMDEQVTNASKYLRDAGVSGNYKEIKQQLKAALSKAWEPIEGVKSSMNETGFKTLPVDAQLGVESLVKRNPSPSAADKEIEEEVRNLLTKHLGSITDVEKNINPLDFSRILEARQSMDAGLSSEAFNKMSYENQDAIIKKARGATKQYLEDIVKNTLGEDVAKNYSEQMSKYGNLSKIKKYLNPEVIKEAGRKSFGSMSVGVASAGAPGYAAGKEAADALRGVKALTKTGLATDKIGKWLGARNADDILKVAYPLRETVRNRGE